MFNHRIGIFVKITLMTSKKKDKAEVHKEIEGLELSIDEFGEIKMNKSQEELNQFLDKHVEDKKLNKNTNKSKV